MIRPALVTNSKTVFETMDSSVNVKHEGIEMDSSLALCGHTIMKKVHEHCFTPTNSSMDIETFGCFSFTPANTKPFRKETGLAWTVALNGFKCFLQLNHCFQLVVIVKQLPCFNFCFVRR